MNKTTHQLKKNFYFSFCVIIKFLTHGFLMLLNRRDKYVELFMKIISKFNVIFF